MNQRTPIIVDAKNLTVAYKLNEFRSSTLKEWIFNHLGGRGKSQNFFALDHVNFQMRRGESVAFIGHNGSGKSTMLRAIAGIIPPKENASVVVHGRVAPLIELGAGFDGELSGRENIYLSCLLMGLTKEEIDQRIEAIIDFSELREFIHMPVKNYSSGMYARLGFACATSVDPDLLIVDEVLAVGDANFAMKCLKRIEELRAKNVSIIIVSHDEGTVRRFCDRALVLNRGKAIFDGDVDEAYQVQSDIMLERAKANMTPEERKRLEKHKEILAREASKNALDTLPHIEVNLRFVQNNTFVRILDFCQPFTLSFEVRSTEIEKFSGDTYFGFEFRHTSGCRVFGAGSEPNVLIPIEVLHQKSRYVIEFEFKDGMKHLCGNRYSVVFAINDQGMNRNVFSMNFGEYEFTNSSIGENEHSDVLPVDRKNLVVQVTDISK